MSKLVNASKYKRWQEERNEQRKKKKNKKMKEYPWNKCWKSQTNMKKGKTVLKINEGRRKPDKERKTVLLLHLLS